MCIDHADNECNALRGECKDQAECIEEEMKNVSDGTRLSARNLDKFDAAQLE